MFCWCECEGGSDGPGELSYALWGHGGRARRPPDGPYGLGARDAKSPAEEMGLTVSVRAKKEMLTMKLREI